MGQMSVEQTVMLTNSIIESTSRAIERTRPETNYWWSLILVIIPVILAYFFRRDRRKKSRRARDS